MILRQVHLLIIYMQDVIREALAMPGRCDEEKRKNIRGAPLIARAIVHRIEKMRQEMEGERVK